MHLREMFARFPRNDLKSTFQNKIMIKKKERSNCFENEFLVIQY